MSKKRWCDDAELEALERYLKERNIAKESNFIWLIPFYPLPWTVISESCGASHIKDADGKDVPIKAVVDLINDFTDTGCPMCGEIR